MAEHAKPSGVAEAPTQAEIVDFLHANLAGGFDLATAVAHYIEMSGILLHNLSVVDNHGCDESLRVVRQSFGCAGVSLLALAEVFGVDLGEAMGESFLALRVTL